VATIDLIAADSNLSTMLDRLIFVHSCYSSFFAA